MKDIQIIVRNTFLAISLIGFGGLIGRIAYDGFYQGSIYGGILGLLIYLYIASGSIYENK